MKRPSDDGDECVRDDDEWSDAGSDDDLEAWREAVEDVRPIRRGGKHRVAPRPERPEPATHDPWLDASWEPGAAPGVDPLQRLPPLSPSSAPGLHRREWDRLRKGRVPIEDTLDLHGATRREAEHRIRHFLERAQDSGCRCVRIVTGKGERSSEGGVLATFVPDCLNASPNRQRVLAFCHARPRDGGRGALYVRVRARGSP